MKTKLLTKNLIRLLCAALLCTALPSLHAQHRFTRLHSFGATNLPMFAPTTLFAGSDGAFYGTVVGIAHTVVRLSQDGSDYTVLHTFSSEPWSGAEPAALLEASDGKLYGTASSGGATGGTVFRLNKDGTGYTVLRAFTGTNGDGSAPFALVEGRDGVLYGSAFGGAGAPCGTVFKLNKDGAGYAVLHRFQDDAEEGEGPVALLEGSDGSLHGATAAGGGSGYFGTIFKLNKDGSHFTVLHRVDTGAGYGSSPRKLMEGSDGALYGTTEYVNETSPSSIFRLNKSGSGFTVLHRLAYPANQAPSLREGPGGALYALLEPDSWPQPGLAFRLNKDGSNFTVLHEFTGSNGVPRYPMTGSLLVSRDTLYGATSFGGTSNLGTLFKLNPDGTGYQVLTSFRGNVPINDGRGPVPPFVEGADGALYGTTWAGGDFNAGTVFRLNKNGTGFSLLHSFPGQPDGEGGPRGLMEGSDGALYGATDFGGSANWGAVYKLDRDDTGYTRLHSFQGGSADGAPHCRALVEGSDGALYGTTQLGGSAYHAGTVFRLNSDGTGYSILHSFQGGSGGGAYPRGPLVEASDGALYGTSSAGGISNAGTVFKLSKDGSTFTLLHHFGSEPNDGESPLAPLTEGSDGALYGVTYSRAVFRLNKDGTGYTQLHQFDYVLHGAPNGPLLEGLDGALYGTTEEGGGGDDNFGTVFRVGKDGSGFSVLRVFRGSDGEYPLAIMEGNDGAIYGVTEDGGDFDLGTLFRLDVAPVLYNPVWSGSFFSFQFNARSNVVYQPQSKSSLADSNWTALPSLTGQRGVVTVTDTNLPAAPRFYRVRVGD